MATSLTSLEDADHSPSDLREVSTLEGNVPKACQVRVVTTSWELKRM